ncbi:MAG: putative MFS family arabinose efflux permease, partial [Candidatus Poriferisodalaceae bacterium]
GAVIASPLVAIVARRISRSVIQQWALVIYGAGITMAGLAPTFLTAMLGLFVMGMAHIASASTLNTSIQMQVDESLRAKVLAVYITTLLIANPLGQLTLGQLIDRVGPRETFVGSGLTLIAAAVLLTVTGKLHGLDDEGDYQPASSSSSLR